MTFPGLQELKALEEKGAAQVIDHVWKNRTMGAEKFFVTWKALQCRKQRAPVFLHGSYIPLYASVDCGCIAYARYYENQWVLVIAPVNFVSETNILKDVIISLPENAPATFTNVFTGATVQNENGLSLHSIIKSFPVALLTG